MAAIPGSGIDALMGTGGTPEGVMSACAIRAIGGEFLGRLDPQLHTEARAVKEAGIDTVKWYDRDEIIASDNVFFCATGITTGLMLEGVERSRIALQGADHDDNGIDWREADLDQLYPERSACERRRARRGVKADKEERKHVWSYSCRNGLITRSFSASSAIQLRVRRRCQRASPRFWALSTAR